MRVLVTGASGFIGTYLVHELIDHGYEVTALTRKKQEIHPKAKVVIGDITEPSTIESYFQDVDAVFHNAAYAMDWGKKDRFYQANVDGTRHVAQACIDHGIKRLIYTSSAGVYGFPSNDELISEDSEKNPLNHYQRTKLLGEQVLDEYPDLSVSSIRPPMVFGANAPALKIVFSNLQKQKFVYIGSGDQQISIAHPADVARLMRIILEKDVNASVYNVVSFITPIKSFIDTIADLCGLEPPQRHVSYRLAYTLAWFSETFIRNPTLTRFRVKSLGTTRRISAEKAKKELGFAPEYDFSRTIEDIVCWYKDTYF